MAGVPARSVEENVGAGAAGGVRGTVRTGGVLQVMNTAENGGMNEPARGGTSVLSCVFVLLGLFMIFVFPVLFVYFELHYLWGVAWLVVFSCVAFVVSRGR